MPRVSVEYKKEANKLIIENLDRFIKRYFNDDRTLITRDNEIKKYKVIEKNDEGLMIVVISRTSFSVCRTGEYFEDFVANVFANVNGKDVACIVDLKWKNNIVGGNIIPQFGKTFSIYEQKVHSGRKLLTMKMKEYYERHYCNNDNIELVDFDFQW